MSETEQTHYLTAYENIKKQLENDPTNQEYLQKKLNLKPFSLTSKNRYLILTTDKLISEQDMSISYSNIGAFGENVYKIGMTRRLNPQDCVDELGDASVPFKFDVHAMIFSDDAPALEAALHCAFEDKKLNIA